MQMVALDGCEPSQQGQQPVLSHNEAPLPDQSADQRQTAIESHDLTATHSEPALDALVRFAARLCKADGASVNLLDRDAVRTIASVGLAGPTPLALVRRTVAAGGLSVTYDTHRDPALTDQPWRFHVGVPLMNDDVAIGTLAVVDTTPRKGLTELQEDGLRLLAEQVAAHFARRRVHAEAKAAAASSLDTLQVRTIIDTIPQMVWSTRPDGHHDFFNARWYEITGTPPGSTDGEGWADLFHPDDQEETWERWSHSLATRDTYRVEYRLRGRDGHWRWVLGRALPLRDAEGEIVRWFGTCTDIDETKRLAEEREVVSHELSHRIKNIFSVISGLLAFSARGRPEVAEFAAELRQRVLALGRAHDFVRPHSEYSEPPHSTDHLHGLILEILAPYGDDRVSVTGANPGIDDRSATPLALLIHELATNAAKYGALSSNEGRIVVTTEERDGCVRLEWCEEGGPPVSHVPDHEGFGTRLIDLSAVRQLGAKLERDWRAEGLSITLEIAAAALQRPDRPPQYAVKPATSPGE